MTLEGVDAVAIDVARPLEIRAETNCEAEITLKSGAGIETVTVSPDDSTATVATEGHGGDGDHKEGRHPDDAPGRSGDAPGQNRPNL